MVQFSAEIWTDISLDFGVIWNLDVSILWHYLLIKTDKLLWKRGKGAENIPG